MRVRLLVILWVLFVAVPPVFAYHFFQNASFQPYRWQHLPVQYKVDNGPTDIQAELQDAATAWNDIPTAVQVLAMTPALNGGAPVDFTSANFGTRWGMMTGDGQQEVVFDEDGSILRDILGLDPASINGYGPSHKIMMGGTAVIDDSYLIINGSRADFDRRSTEVHELGHTLGLAHSSVGMFNSAAFPSDALEVVAIEAVPTMHPFSSGTGTNRRTPEADDRAAISELYPDATVTSLGSISGKITRCGTLPEEPLTGVNVRVVKVGDPSVQVTRYTAFDGNPDGRYQVDGLPPGSYHVIVEPLGANGFTAASLAISTRLDQGFSNEYFSAAECPEDLPDTPQAISVAGGGSATADIAVSGVHLALVVDDTGSMGEEIGGVREILNNFIDIIDGIPFVDFPSTAIFTYKDDVTLRIVSSDPERLREVVNSLQATGGADCPESSNSALLAAGRMVQPLGVVLNFTDADSRPDGPTRQEVAELYRSRGILLSTLLSGTCTSAGLRSSLFHSSSSNGQAAAPQVGQTAGTGTHAQLCASAVADEYPSPPTLGTESALETFPSLAAATGGFFFASDPDSHYVNTGTNIAVSTVTPAVGLIIPDRAKRGTSLEAEVLGGNTNFRSTSTVTFADPAIAVTAVRVLSPTRLIANVTVRSSAALGFSDVKVTTDLGGGVIEHADGLRAFEVISESSLPAITSLVPSHSRLGETIRASLTAANVDFTHGTPSVQLGAGILVSNITVLDPTHLELNLAVAPDAVPGPRNIDLTSGGSAASLPSGFLVLDAAEPIPTLLSILPGQGVRGQVVTLSVTGQNTHFVDGISQLSMSGSGITVLSIQVTSPTTLSAEISVSAAAPPGFSDVRVTTGSEIAAGLDAFEVTVAPINIQAVPTLSEVGLAALAFLLAASSILFLRRRRNN